MKTVSALLLVSLLVAVAGSTLAYEVRSAFEDSESGTDSDTECFLCRYIVGEIEQFVSENKTLEEMEALLEKVCDRLPSSFASACDELVDTYLPYLVETIVNNDPVDQVCSELQLCNSTRDFYNGQPPVDNLFGGNTKCVVCQLVVSEVQELLNNNLTETQIVKALEAFCHKLPEGYQDTCVSLVDLVPYIIQELANVQTPEQVCQTLKLCTQTHAVPVVIARAY